MLIDKTLKKQIEECVKEGNMEMLLGLASNTKEKSVQMSWEKAYEARAGAKIRLGGRNEVAQVLGISPDHASKGIAILRNFEHLAEKFPRLSYSFFYSLLDKKLTKEQQVKLLEEADDNSSPMPITIFKRRVNEELGIKEEEPHVCPLCGKKHRRGEKHGE